MASDSHAARWSGRGKRSVQVNEAAAPPPPAPAPPPVITPEPAPEPEPEVAPEATAPEEPVEELLATDAARQLAAEWSIDLAKVTGTGAEGRITKDDVAALLPDANS